MHFLKLLKRGISLTNREETARTATPEKEQHHKANQNNKIQDNYQLVFSKPAAFNPENDNTEDEEADW